MKSHRSTLSLLIMSNRFQRTFQYLRDSHGLLNQPHPFSQPLELPCLHFTLLLLHNLRLPWSCHACSPPYSFYTTYASSNTYLTFLMICASTCRSFPPWREQSSENDVKILWVLTLTSLRQMITHLAKHSSVAVTAMEVLWFWVGCFLGCNRRVYWCWQWWVLLSSVEANLLSCQAAWADEIVFWGFWF